MSNEQVTEMKASLGLKDGEIEQVMQRVDECLDHDLTYSLTVELTKEINDGGEANPTEEQVVQLTKRAYTLGYKHGVSMVNGLVQAQLDRLTANVEE